MDILAEAATTQMPPASDPGVENVFRDVINNPQIKTTPPDLLLNAALQLAMKHGMSGSMPGLQRSLLDQIAQAHLHALDTEARLQPSLARMLLQGESQPTMQDLLDQAGGTPNLSEFFGGLTPTANSEMMQNRAALLSDRLQALAPRSKEGQSAAALDEIASENNLHPDHLAAADRLAQPATGGLEDLANSLQWLAYAGRQPDKAPDILNSVIGRMNPAYHDRMRQAIVDALQTANIGSETQVPGLDPASRRSLAPDFSPSALGYGMMSDARQNGSQTPDLELLLKLMGMSQSNPRSNV